MLYRVDVGGTGRTLALLDSQKPAWATAGAHQDIEDNSIPHVVDPFPGLRSFAELFRRSSIIVHPSPPNDKKAPNSWFCYNAGNFAEVLARWRATCLDFGICSTDGYISVTESSTKEAPW